jgi:DNA-binding transcriptional ArsR family regulator
MSAPPPLDQGLIKALAHPLRWRIVEVLVERGEASPVELARTLDQPLATVSHHVRVLRDQNSIELVRTEPRRGAVEHYYRARMPAFFDDDQWSLVPTMLRRGLSGQLFQRLFAEAAAAGSTGAFDAPTSHMDRLIVELDDEARRELSALLTELMRSVQAIQERSEARRDGNESRQTVALTILAFEVAESLARHTAADAEPPRRSPPLPAA